MYYVFSKALLFLILPINWIIASIVIALFINNKQNKRRYLWFSLLLFLVFSNPLLLNRVSRLWHVKASTLPNKQYSCAIVLGGFAGEKNDGEGYFTGAADRYIQAVKLQMTGKVSHLMITGGEDGKTKKTDFIEAIWVKSQLHDLKLPDSCLLSEELSRNTFENASFSKPILLKSGLKPPYVLITSAVHMRRSLLIFKNVGLDVVPYPCNYMTGIDRFAFREFVPDADVLAEWNYYIKEMVGYIVTTIRGWLKL